MDMLRPRLHRLLILSLFAAGWAAGTTPVAAQSEAIRPEAAERTHTPADARFMQGMIPHHAQALDMTSLVPARTTRRDVLLLAERIEVAQGDEIAWMQRWLQDRGEEAPMAGGGHAHHGAGHHALMPGMLTPEQLAQLAAASGSEFDRLFLEFMIQHHEGALVMVDDLLASPGAAQLTEVYRFASDIDADQRADIARMKAMLEAPLVAPDER
jgi:uncharacterized protein (DUF305 family)